MFILVFLITISLVINVALGVMLFLALKAIHDARTELAHTRFLLLQEFHRFQPRVRATSHAPAVQPARTKFVAENVVNLWPRPVADMLAVALLKQYGEAA